MDRRVVHRVVARTRLVKIHKRQRRRVVTAQRKIAKLRRRHRPAQHSRQLPTLRRSPIDQRRIITKAASASSGAAFSCGNFPRAK